MQRNKSSLCCTQVVNTKTFESCQTNRTFKIFHKLNCKSSFVIYLMKCAFCEIQYVGKVETLFNIQLNTHRKDANGSNPKITLYPFISNTINTDVGIIKIRLKGKEDFWILKLDTLTPKGLNQELKHI